MPAGCRFVEPFAARGADPGLSSRDGMSVADMARMEETRAAGEPCEAARVEPG